MSRFNYLKCGIVFIVLAFISSLFYVQENSLIDTDSGIHLFRMISLSENLSHGELLPSLSDRNLYGSGYLFDIFYPVTTLYAGAIISLLGVPYKTAFLINIIIVRFVSFILAFIASDTYFKDNKKSFIFSIIYIIGFCRLFPYCYGGLFADDTSSLAFPLVFFGAIQLKNNKKWKMLAFGMSLMLYCHMLSFYLSVLFCFIYFFILNIKIFIKKDYIISLLKAALVSLCVCSGFLIPFLFNMIGVQYRLQSNSSVWNGIQSNNFFFPNITSLPDGMIGNVIRLLCLIFFICGIHLLHRRSMKKDTPLSPFFVSFLIYVFLSTDLFPFWIFSNVGLVEIIQFAFRIANIIYLPSCIFLCTVLCSRKFELSVFITVSVLFLGVNLLPKNTTNTPSFYLNEKNNTYVAVGLAEFLPEDYHAALTNNDYGINDMPAYDYAIADNNTELKIPVERSWHKTTLDIKTNNTNVRTYLVYYKNYKATINGKPIDVINNSGMVCIDNVPAGTLEISYQTPLYQIIVSVFSIIFFLSFSIWSIYTNKKSGS